MSGNRSATEQFILKYIGRLTTDQTNTQLYRDMFAAMSDADFESWIKDLESGERFLTAIDPNFSTGGLSVERNLDIAKELGHDFFEAIWIQGTGDVPTYLTPIKYMVVDLPVKRASQLLTKKISVPDDNNTVDQLTGQPTGESKGARISYPELQVSAAMGLEQTMVELMKYRGGDVKGGAAYNNLLSKTGSVSLKTLSQYASGVESINTMRTFLSCMHLRSTL